MCLLVRLICCRIILTASSPGRLSRELSREVRRLLLDLNPYGGTDKLGPFPLCLKRTADVMPHPVLV